MDSVVTAAILAYGVEQMKARVLAIIIISTVALQGCIYTNTRGYRADDQGHHDGQPTIGQQLLDLDRARAAGAITGAEYDRLKAKIIDGVD